MNSGVHHHTLNPDVHPYMTPMNYLHSKFPKTNFVEGMKELTASTHAKFMKLVRLDFPKYSDFYLGNLCNS